MSWIAWTAAGAIVLRLAAQLVLAFFNAAEVRRNRDHLPAAFRGVTDESAYQRSMDCTLAKNRFGRVEAVWSAFVLAAVLLSGILPLAWSAWVGRVGSAAWAGALFCTIALLALAVPDLPFEWWAQFRLEQRFGFNRSTVRLWVSDHVKGVALALVLGFPLIWLLLKLVEWLGARWWLYGWAAFMVFQLLMVLLYPTLILPWFNKLTPLPGGNLRETLLGLAERAKFRASTIQVMDGSKRSAHSNAFFTGFGRFRRIVLFDTLVQQLEVSETEAVLAHEIGHYKLGHIVRGLLLAGGGALAAFACVGWLLHQPEFFTAFGFAGANAALALLLFALLGGLVGFWITPLANALSRHHEYQADAFARELLGSADPLIGALRKLTRENLSNLTPHRLFSAFYYSHPTLAEREAALRRAT